MPIVYVIGPKNGPYKIGITNNLKVRLEGLQTGNHQKLLVHDQREDANAINIEKRLHAKFAAHRLLGEWFDLPLEKISHELSTVSVEPIDEVFFDAYDFSSEDLRRWREDKLFSQAEAARKLGCSRTSIMNWEKGQKIPTTIALACLALTLGLSPIGS